MEGKEVMLGVPEEDAETVELMEHRAMVCLPEDSVEVQINCKVYKDGELIIVKKTMSMSDLRTAFKKADDGYIDDEDTFVLTDKGKAYLEELHRDR